MEKEMFVPTAEQQKRWLAEERHFKNLSAAFIARPVSVHGILPFKDDIGYTFTENKYGKILAKIFVARLHQLMLDLSEQERSFFRLGVYAHEALHQIFTDFDTTKKMAKEMSPQKRNIFKEVSNIVEDTRIEYFAHQVIGGESLSALGFTIRHIYLNSEIGKEMDPISQALNALIQLGDMGIIRGKFTYPEAIEIFKRIVPLFEEAVTKTVCSDALKISEKITDILLEYAGEYEDFLDELFKNSTSDKASGKGKPADEEDEDDETSSSSTRGSSKAKRKASKELMDKLGVESSDSTDTSDEKTSDKSSDEDADAPLADGDFFFDEDDDELDVLDFGENEEKGEKEKTSESSETDSSTDKLSLTEDELKDIEDFNTILQEEFENKSEDIINSVDYSEDIFNTDKAIKEESESMKKAEKANASDKAKDSIPASETIDGDSFVSLILNKKMPPITTGEYELLVEKVSPYISSTCKAVQRSLREEFEEKERHTSGEININRYYNPAYTSSRIFDRRKEPHKSSDVCMVILVDESGSMSGPNELAARESAILLAEVCAKLKIPCYIVGFSGDENTNCEVNLRHYVTWKNTKSDRSSLVAIRGRVQNRDGASIRAITKIAKKRREENKILFVISDGQPAANNYGGPKAILDTKNAIREARKVFTTAVGISIGKADKDIIHEMYGNDFLSVVKPSDLPIELSKLFKKMFK